MGRLYKITPPCPKCHEEHNWWHIQLTDEEQAKMDAYVAASVSYRITCNNGNQRPLINP